MEENRLWIEPKVDPSDGLLSSAETAAVKDKLLKLLARRTAMYAGGDSSVRAETARELFESIEFCLKVYLQDSGNTNALLVTADLNELLDLSFETIERGLVRLSKLFAAACKTAPKIENVSYTETLRSISGFRKRYDYRYFAGSINCDIDYQPLETVSETLFGFQYVSEYLRRIVIENIFMGCFETDLVRWLLADENPDFSLVPTNMCRPVLENALGLALAGKSVRGLRVETSVLRRLEVLLDPLTERQTEEKLRLAATEMLGELHISDENAKEYLLAQSVKLGPRLQAAKRHGSMGNIFRCFP